MANINTVELIEETMTTASTIKAYAATEVGGKLTPFEYKPDPLKDTDVEIDVEYCGLCHSDLSMLDNEWGVTQYPFVPGHEVIGRVAKIGSAVKSLQVGQQVGLGRKSPLCRHSTITFEHLLILDY